MDEFSAGSTAARIAELERLISEFKEKFNAGVSNADTFISITEIEKLWSELTANTNNIYSDMIRELMSSVNERDLIRKKKESTKPGG